MKSLQSLTRLSQIRAARKRGVTLIEAVLYISIALALIVGGLVFFQQASLAQRTNGAVRNISAIASETRALYQASPNYSGFTQTALINAGAVPSSLINAGALQNEWSGAIQAVASNVSGTNNDGFSVIYENVPTNACVRLSTYDAQGTGRVGSGIAEVRWRAGSDNTAAAANAANNFVSATAAQLVGGIDPTEASTLCTANDDAAGLIDIEFRMQR